MATQFEIVIYVKAHGDLDGMAHAIFGTLGTDEFISENSPDLGGDYARLTTLGLEATVFSNAGEMEDEDFAEYPYGLGIASTYLDPDLELATAESALADYYARLLAFTLDVETATSFYLGAQDGVDVYEIRAFRRNPQFAPDAGPTAQHVYISDRRTVEYDTEVVEEDFEEDAAFEDE